MTFAIDCIVTSSDPAKTDSRTFLSRSLACLSDRTDSATCPISRHSSPAEIVEARTSIAEADVTAVPCRRTHFADRSHGEGRRARIISSARNRRRSSASSRADPYRDSGALAIALRMIVSRSRGIVGSILRGAVGSSLST